MKKLFTILLVALMVQISFAQEEKTEEKDPMQTIFTKDNLKFTGGFIAPEIKVSDVHEDISLLVGGSIGLSRPPSVSAAQSNHMIFCIMVSHYNSPSVLFSNFLFQLI